jgi:hypothetical protein
MIRRGCPSCCSAVILLAGVVADVSAQSTTGQVAVEYNRDIRPILSDKCFRCHGPDGARKEILA